MSFFELGALASRLVELEVQPEHGDVDRDDAGEQHREDDDPDDAAARRSHERRRGDAADTRPPAARAGCAIVAIRRRTAARSRAEPRAGCRRSLRATAGPASA